jgi:hypothetical protein
VLPEAEEVDITIEDKDLRIDVYRSSGPGGQSVNTTDSAVRITHLPTGLVVIQQDEKSQHKNKAKALKVLRARLYEDGAAGARRARAADRKSQVGSGDRSERVRTYNFPQGRVTDHRINLTLYKIDKVMAGEALDEIIDALTQADTAERSRRSWSILPLGNDPAGDDRLDPRRGLRRRWAGSGFRRAAAPGPPLGRGRARCSRSRRRCFRPSRSLITEDDAERIGGFAAARAGA